MSAEHKMSLIIRVTLAGAVLLSAAQGPALAATQAAAKPAAAKPAAAKPAAATAPLSADQQEHAVQDFAIMASAMRSDKVGNDVKSALMGCIYSNKLESISTAIDRWCCVQRATIHQAPITTTQVPSTVSSRPRRLSVGSITGSGSSGTPPGRVPAASTSPVRASDAGAACESRQPV